MRKSRMKPSSASMPPLLTTRRFLRIARPFLPTLKTWRLFVSVFPPRRRRFWKSRLSSLRSRRCSLVFPSRKRASLPRIEKREASPRQGCVLEGGARSARRCDRRADHGPLQSHRQGEAGCCLGPSERGRMQYLPHLVRPEQGPFASYGLSALVLSALRKAYGYR